MEYKIASTELYSFSDINEKQDPEKRNRILNLLDSGDFDLCAIHNGLRINLDKKYFKYKYVSTNKKTYIDFQNLYEIDNGKPIYYFLYEFYWNEGDSKLDITKYSNINILKINNKTNTFTSLPIINNDRLIKYRNKKLSKI